LTLAEQAERRRISQTLHDDLQQLLYAIQMRLTDVMQALPAERAELQEQGQQTLTWFNEAIRITRQLTVELSPPVLKEEGLVDALRWLAVQMAETHQLAVEIVAKGAFRLANEDMRVLLFQIVRELLFNVVKHAGVQHATVTIEEGEEGQLTLKVQDGGRGFDLAAAETRDKGGFGLFSVRERLALFGGHMEIITAPGDGTEIVLSIAMNAPTDELSSRER